jgi:5-methyltetrahydropteroyltriglutamate--homocysteine methyltransferase
MNDHRKFLTAHVGGLPRAEELKQLMFAREDGLPFDASALDEQATRASGAKRGHREQ